MPGNGDGTFGAAITTPTSGTIEGGPLVVADFNGDGIPDLVCGQNVFLGNGDGTFKLSATLSAANEVYGQPVAADFNGDGIIDLAITSGSSGPGVVSIFLGNGDGTFGSPVGFTAGNDPVWAGLGDFNGDGKPDLAVANYHSNNVTILTNTTP